MSTAWKVWMANNWGDVFVFCTVPVALDTYALDVVQDNYAPEVSLAVQAGVSFDALVVEVLAEATGVLEQPVVTAGFLAGNLAIGCIQQEDDMGVVVDLHTLGAVPDSVTVGVLGDVLTVIYPTC